VFLLLLGNQGQSTCLLQGHLPKGVSAHQVHQLTPAAPQEPGIKGPTSWQACRISLMPYCPETCMAELLLLGF
jgi:hypothetical protein